MNTYVATYIGVPALVPGEQIRAVRDSCNERGRQLRRPYINAITSPMATKAFKLVTAMPRYRPSMMRSDCVPPQLHHAEGGDSFRGESTKVYLRGGLKLAAVARPLTSPLPDPFSADRGGRNRDTGTSVVPRHREAALGSKWPRNRGKSDVRPGPYGYFLAANL